MNKPHIELLPKDERFLGLNWTCTLNGGNFIKIGYGRNPVEAYRDYSLDDDFSVFDEVFGMNVEEEDETNDQ